MTKRLVEFVEALEDDELVIVASLIDARYRKFSATLWNQIEMVEDLFLGNVLAWLCRMIEMESLFDLRRVSKRWFLQIKRVDYLRFPHFYPNTRLTNYFTAFRFIRTDVSILAKEAFIDSFQKVVGLEIDYSDRKGNWEIQRWTSLKSLSVGEICGTVLGLSSLTSLTYLDCDSDVFAYEDQIFSLPNLTSLTASGFSLFCPLSYSLPKLTYLESDCPRHFSHFTGRGKLDTEGIFFVNDFNGSAREMAQKGFDHYAKDCTSLRIYGQWLEGVFSGDAHIGFPFTPYQVSGPMIDGKFHGLVQEGFDVDRESYVGYYENGLRHGKGTRTFRISRENRVFLKKEEEEWNHGSFISVEI